MAIRITREEYERKFGISPTTTNERPQVIHPPDHNQPLQRRADFTTGVAKSALGTVKGLEQLGGKVSRAITPKKFEKYLPEVTEEEMQGTPGLRLFTKKNLEVLPGEGAGKFVGDVAQFAIPGFGVAKGAKGLPRVAQIARQAVTQGEVAAAQSGDIGKEAATAAGITAVLPVVGKVVSPAARLSIIL